MVAYCRIYNLFDYCYYRWIFYRFKWYIIRQFDQSFINHLYMETILFIYKRILLVCRFILDNYIQIYNDFAGMPDDNEIVGY